jgi:hypothetical protein
MHSRASRNQRVRRWLVVAWIAFAILALTTKPAYSATSTSDALDLAYEFQIKAIRTQVKYETLQESYDLRIAQLEQENKRLFWLNVASVIALAYSTTNK